MNATLRCGKCGHDAVVSDFNLSRVMVKCPVADCGFPNSVVQMLENFYGNKIVTRELKKDLEKFHRMKVKNDDSYLRFLFLVDKRVQEIIDKATPPQQRAIGA